MPGVNDNLLAVGFMLWILWFFIKLPICYIIGLIMVELFCCVIDKDTEIYKRILALIGFIALVKIFWSSMLMIIILMAISGLFGLIKILLGGD